MPRHALLLGWGLLTAALYAMTWNRESIYLLAVAGVLLAILLIGLVLPWLATRTTTLSLMPPSAAHTAAPASLQATAHNRFWWPHEGLVLQLALSPKTTAAPHYLPLPLPRIYPGQHALHLALPTLPRGRYQLAASTLSSSYPFGFWSPAKPVSADSHAVVIRPYRFPVDAPALLAGIQKRPAGISAQNRAGFSSEFLGVREYRAGDSVRHVDWKSSARQGQLIVREFEDMAAPECLVVLDTHAGFARNALTRARFEACVSVAASVADATLSAGIGVGLHTANHLHTRLLPATGEMQAWRLLEAFTDIQPESLHGLPPVLRVLLHQPPTHTLFIVADATAPHWPDSEDLLKQLAVQGHALLLVLTNPEQTFVKKLRPYCLAIYHMGQQPVEKVFS